MRTPIRCSIVAFATAAALIAEQLYVVVLHGDSAAHQVLVDLAGQGAHLERAYTSFAGFVVRASSKGAIEARPGIAALFPVESAEALNRLESAVLARSAEIVKLKGLDGNEPFTHLVDRIADEHGLTVLASTGRNTLRNAARGRTALEARARSLSGDALTAIIEDSVPAQAFRLYRLQGQPGRRALVWNTHFRNGIEPVENGLRLDTFDAGVPVLKVSGGLYADEAFALAVEGALLEPVDGPALRVRCGEGVCTVLNAGDLAAFSLRTTGDEPVDLGTLQPGQEVQFPEPGGPGTVISDSYGVQWTATYDGTLTACLGSVLVSPPTAVYSNAAGTGKARLSVPFGCTWRTVLSSGIWGWLTTYDDILGREVRYSFGENTRDQPRTERLLVQIFNGATWVNSGVYHEVTQNKAPNSIRVLSPNGGEVWETGSQYSIRWAVQGSVGSAVRVEALHGGSVIFIANAQAPAGSVSWLVPQSLAGASNLRIRVSGLVSDTSDGAFSVRAKPLKVTAPNGGVLFRGSTINVGVGGPPGASVNVALVGPVTTVLNPALVLGATGAASMPWMVPLNQPEGIYRVRAGAGTEVTHGDNTAVKKVQVEVTVSPATVEEGKPVTVTVRAAAGEKVKLSLVTGNGAVAVPGEFGPGQHQVAIPIPVGRGYKIQAVSTSDANNKHSSNAFDVAAPPPPPPPPPPNPVVRPGSSGLIIEVNGTKTEVNSRSAVYIRLVNRYGEDAQRLLDAMIASTKYEYPYEITKRRTEQSLVNLVSLRALQIAAARYLAVNKPAFADGQKDGGKIVIALPATDSSWQPEERPRDEWKGIEVRRGKKPSDAVREFFEINRTGEFALDCYNAQLLAYLKGRLDYLGDVRFNFEYATATLKLTADRSIIPYTYAVNQTFEMLPGDGVSFKKPGAPVNSPDANYNLLYLGRGRYYGHDGGDMSAADLEKKGYKFDAKALLRWPVPDGNVPPLWQIRP